MWTISNVINVKLGEKDRGLLQNARIVGEYERLQPLCWGSKQQCLDYIESGANRSWPGRATVMHSPSGRLALTLNL